jgi:hypothetical protein
MILTKETYIIHLVSLGLAYPTLLLLEKVYPSRGCPRALRDGLHKTFTW